MDKMENYFKSRTVTSLLQEIDVSTDRKKSSSYTKILGDHQNRTELAGLDINSFYTISILYEE